MSGSRGDSSSVVRVFVSWRTSFPAETTWRKAARCRQKQATHRPHVYPWRMTGAEIAALGWIASFVNTLLGGVTDRLKKQPSSDRAREYAFDLFESLAGLGRTSDSFVHSLQAVSDGVPSAEGALRQALKDVSRALGELEHALHRIDPQLEVHVPETAREVNEARMSRALVISQAEESLGALARGEDDVDFATILGDAKRARQEIEVATETLRAFLAEQFSFKESF